MILFGKKIPIFFSLVIWFIVWELIGQAGLSTIIPPFSRVVAAGITIVPTEKFSAAASISLRSFAIGMALSLAIGIPFGVLMARVESLGRILGMWVNIFVSAQHSALVPIPLAGGGGGGAGGGGASGGRPGLPFRRLRDHPGQARGGEAGGPVTGRDGALVRCAAGPAIYQGVDPER